MISLTVRTGCSDRAHTSAVALLCLLLVLAAGVGASEGRVALVIGNAAYKEVPLNNPVNDARAMAVALRHLGFEVISVDEANHKQMQGAVLQFAQQLQSQDTGLFYYAGHGIQVDGSNYLIPRGAEISSEVSVRFEAINVGDILDVMEKAGNKLNVVILDACRNNPFERRLRGNSRGLAAIDAAAGTLIAYATAPGSVAADGTDKNGLYTEALLDALAVPGLKVEEVFKQVRINVAERFNGLQIPWESSSLTGDFVFNVSNVESVTVTTVQPSANTDALFWESIKDSDDPEDFRAYLDQFPSGVFAKLATNFPARLATPIDQTASTSAQGETIALASPSSSSTQPASIPASQLFIEVTWQWTLGGSPGSASGLVSVSGRRIQGEIRSQDGTINLKGTLVEQKVELTGTIRPDARWLGDRPWRLRQFKIHGLINNGVLVQTVLTGTGGALITTGSGEFETSVSIKSQLGISAATTTVVASSPPFTVALLKVGVADDQGSREKRFGVQVERMIEQDPRLKLARSYYSDASFRSHPVHSDQLWLGSLSRRHPDIEFVYRHSATLGVDAVVVFWLRSTQNQLSRQTPADVYLIDLVQRKQLVAKGKQNEVKELMTHLSAQLAEQRRNIAQSQ